MQYLDSLSGGGGTHMLEGITASLDRSSDDPQRLRFVAFLTDGYIGNEREILAEVNRRIGNARIFSFGVGSSVNRYLLDHMAKAGNGAAAYLSLNESGAEIMDNFFQRIRHPAMTHLSIDWGDLEVTDVFPQRVGDLFVGRPVVLTGRFRGEGEANVRISSNVAGERREIVVPLDPLRAEANHSAIAAVWARAKIADLADRSIWQNNPDLPNDIRQVALAHGLMSAYTAFVAVDSTARTSGDFGTTVAVPVPVPDGVRYETTVQE